MFVRLIFSFYLFTLLIQYCTHWKKIFCEYMFSSDVITIEFWLYLSRSNCKNDIICHLIVSFTCSLSRTWFEAILSVIVCAIINSVMSFVVIVDHCCFWIFYVHFSLSLNFLFLFAKMCLVCVRLFTVYLNCAVWLRYYMHTCVYFLVP